MRSGGPSTVIYIRPAFNETVHAKRAFCLVYIYKNQGAHIRYTQESEFGDLNI